MLRVEYLFNIYKNKKIFASREGQNWQLLIPMAYFYPYGTIDDIVYTIVARRNSHSRKYRDVDSIMLRYDGLFNILEEISKFFSDKYREEFLEKVRLHYCREKFITSIQYNNEKISKLCYESLIEYNLCTVKDRLKYWRYKLKMLFIRKI